MPAVQSPDLVAQQPLSESLTRQLALHHVAVQTPDLDNSVAWYRDFLGGAPQWTLSTFSDLTRRRLPGITRLTEVTVGGLRFHLFERPGQPVDVASSRVSYQHLCVAVAEPADLTVLRERWIDLRASGRYILAVDEPPTEVVVDADGVMSFYAYDVNGLEFEFSYAPPAGIGAAAR